MQLVTAVQLDWQEIYLLQNITVNPAQQILQKYSNVFQEGLGTLTGFKANIIVDPSAPPKYCKITLRPILFMRQS